MVQKRVTPEEDYKRLAQNVLGQFPKIRSDSDYYKAFNSYITNVDDQATFHKMRNKSYRHFEKILKKKGIKIEKTDAKERQLQTNKLLTTGILSRQTTAEVRKEISYRYLGYVGKKVVYARRDTIKIKGKKVDRYRDKLGRFVSLRRRK